MSDDERCTADFLDATVDCELPAGHEGDHQCLFTWPQADPIRDAFEAVVLGGFFFHLLEKYGHAPRTSA